MKSARNMQMPWSIISRLRTVLPSPASTAMSAAISEWSFQNTIRRPMGMAATDSAPSRTTAAIICLNHFISQRSMPMVNYWIVSRASHDTINTCSATRVMERIL